MHAQDILSHGYLTRLEVGLLNDACEMCHRLETDLYRGNVGVRLARRAWKGPVTCTDCHDFAVNKTVSEKCVECHPPRYAAFLTEWGTGFDEEAALVQRKLERVESTLARVPRESVLARRAGRLMKEAREALDLVQRGRAAHHPEAAESLLLMARRKAGEALEAGIRQ